MIIFAHEVARRTPDGRPQCEKGHRAGWPFVNSSSKQVSEIAAACDNVLLVNWRWYELKTVPPHDVLDVIRIGPEGVEDAARIG